MPTVIGPSEPPIMVVMPEAIACSQSWRGIEMDMNVDAARRGDQAFGIAHRRCRAADEVGVDAVHGRRIAGLADVDDAAVLDADVAFDDAEHGVDHQGVAQEHVERAHGAVVARARPSPSRRVLPPPCRHSSPGTAWSCSTTAKQRGVAEADRIAGRRAVHSRIVAALIRAMASGSLEAAALGRAAVPLPCWPRCAPSRRSGRSGRKLAACRRRR